MFSKEMKIVEFSPCIANLSRLSYSAGTYPSQWKIGKVKVLWKSGNKEDCSNYRPITLSSIPSKIIEIEDITRWREDMNFTFEWEEQYLTRSLRSLVRYCSCHENIKFISSSQRVMFFLLYGETNSTKAKGGNRDVIERYDTHKGDIRKIRHSGPG